MNKLKVAFWCMLLAALLFAGLFTYQTTELNSERSKRVELEGRILALSGAIMAVKKKKETNQGGQANELDREHKN